LIFVSLAACNLPGPDDAVAAAGPQAWIDAPLDHDTLPLAPYEIVAHASDPGGMAQIEISVDGAVIGTISGSEPLLTARQTWTPPAPGEYLIQARALNSGGVWSDYAAVSVIVAGELATSTPGLTATPLVPTLILIQNANCRLGPGLVYEVMTALLAGNQLPIEGKNEDGTWWLVRLPTGERCWMSAAIGNPAGEINTVPVAQASPPPEPTPLPGCFVYDPNLQPVCTVPCPENADPGGECAP
jgi:hypothetical protein